MHPDLWLPTVSRSPQSSDNGVYFSLNKSCAGDLLQNRSIEALPDTIDLAENTSRVRHTALRRRKACGLHLAMDRDDLRCQLLTRAPQDIDGHGISAIRTGHHNLR